MNCPGCQTPGAYVGFNTVECVNSKCKHATKEAKEGKTLAKVIDELSAALTAGNYITIPAGNITWRGSGHSSTVFQPNGSGPTGPVNQPGVQAPATPTISKAQIVNGHSYYIINTNKDSECSICGDIQPFGKSIHIIPACTGIPLAAATPAVPKPTLPAPTLANVMPTMTAPGTYRSVHNGHEFFVFNPNNGIAGIASYACSICYICATDQTLLSSISPCRGPISSGSGAGPSTPPPAPNFKLSDVTITSGSSGPYRMAWGHKFISMGTSPNTHKEHFQCFYCQDSYDEDQDYALIPLCSSVTVSATISPPPISPPSTSVALTLKSQPTSLDAAGNTITKLLGHEFYQTFHAIGYLYSACGKCGVSYLGDQDISYILPCKGP